MLGLGCENSNIPVLMDYIGEYDAQRVKFLQCQDVEDEIDIEDLIEEEECVFTLTAGGYIKRTAASTYKAQRRGGKGITAMSTKEEDYVDTVFTASTHDFILFFTNKGRVHRKKGYQIPEAGRTARGTNWSMSLPIEQDEKVTAMIHLREFPEDRYLVMVTRSGTVKRIQLSSIYTARKAASAASPWTRGMSSSACGRPTATRPS